MILNVQQYRDRTDAGRLLARHLAHYASRVDAVVLGLPRGGMPVAAQVAQYLSAPLDAFIVRRIGLPDHPDITLGAIASGGVRVLEDEVIRNADLSATDIAAITERELGELQRIERLYRDNRQPLQLAGRIVIMVADGLATEPSMHAAVIAVHQRQPAWLVVAAPVGSPEACDELAQEAHEVVCPLRPQPLEAIGLWYDHFTPVGDDEIRACLRRAGSLGHA